MASTSARTVGTLYIVATPIGHREDISARALQVLQSVDLIFAEDTRHSMPLLTSLGIKKPMISLHAHNEAHKSEQLIAKLQAGLSCALISDAGTPLISDPGFPLVKQAHAAEIPVVPIPGACALITALSAAGIPCDTFSFFGFLPAKRAARQEKLKTLRPIEHTLVFYESTHRILDSIDDIALIFGEACDMVLAKELTKAFERFITGSCQQIKQWLLEDSNHTKGEFVLIISPRTVEKVDRRHEHLLSVLLTDLPLKQAVKLASEITNEPKNELYKIALTLKKPGVQE